MTAPAQSKPRDLDTCAATILVACCLIWGVGLVMVKIANAGISPIMNSALRSVAAGFILLVWSLARGVPLFRRDRTLIAGIACGTLFALEFLTLYAGLVTTDVARGIIFLHAAPFVAAYGEHLFVPGHRLTRRKVVGLAAALFGLIIALSESLFSGTRTTLTGDILCLIAGIAWGGTTVIIRATQLKSAPAEKTLLYQLAVSAMLLVTASYLLGEPGIINLSPPVLGAFAYTVIGTVVLGYTTWFWLMRTYSAASLHAFTFLTPIFGVVAGHLILGERIGWPIVGGLILVVLGIWLVNAPERLTGAKA